MSVTAAEYLMKIWENEEKIRNKQIERKYWMDLATGITAGMGGERVQSSKTGNPKEDNVTEAVDIDREIAELKREINEIIATIQMLPRVYYSVLHKLYVQRKSLKEVQAEAKKSYSWATTTHSRAKKKLQYILDERERAGAK